MKKQLKNEEVAERLASMLEANRGSLSVNDVQVLKDAISALKKLDNSDPKEFSGLMEGIAISMLRLCMRPEILEQIAEWLNH